MIGDTICQEACNLAECGWDSSDCSCAPGCSTLGLRTDACLVPECMYDSIDVSSLDCSVATCLWLDDYTEECWATLPTCSVRVRMNCCEGCCLAGFMPHPENSVVCVRAPDRSSLLRPRLLHVSATEAVTGADGSLEKPFGSLCDAMLRLYESYTSIILLPGSHVIEACSAVIQSLTDYYDGKLMHMTYPSVKRLNITAHDCIDKSPCTRAVLMYTKLNTPFFHLRMSWLEVTHVDFVSTLPFNTCDRGTSCWEPMDFFKADEDVYLTLVFSHVSFRHFHNAVSSLFKTNRASICFQDVDFEDIIISHQYDSAFVYSQSLLKFTYIGGSVTLTNSGSDYEANSASKSFLSALTVDFLLENVHFGFNFLGSLSSSSSKLSALIQMDACLHCFLRNCVFENNIASSLIYYSGTFLNNFLFGIETTRLLVSSSVEVTGCEFRNNTGHVGSSLNFQYPNFLQNLTISNCTFVNELSAQYGVITISSSSAKAFRSTPSWKFISDSQGRQVPLNFSATEVVLSNLTFINCTVAETDLLAIARMPRVRVSRLFVDSSGSFLSPDRLSNTLNAFGALGYHIPLNVPPLLSTPCKYLLNFTSVYHLTLDSLLTTSMKCSIDLFVTAEFLTMSDSEFSETELPSGTVLYLNVSNSVALSRIRTQNNTSLMGLGTVFLVSEEVLIQDCSFVGNTAEKGAGVYLQAVLRVRIENSVFRGNHGQSGAGVFIHLQPYDFSHFCITNCSFFDNSADESGGSISIELSRNNATVTFDFSNCLFSGNSAKYGSALFASTGILFTNDSRVDACEFLRNTAAATGTIHFSLSAGNTGVTRSSFTANSGGKGTALYRQASNDSQVRLSDVSFEANTGTSIIEIRGSQTLVTASSLRFTRNSGTCVKLDSTVCVGTQLDFVSNHAITGAALHLISSSVSLTRSVFVNNSAESYGGAGFVDRLSRLECFASNFTSNEGSFGGALYVKQHSSIGLTSTLFSGNSAKEGFAIFISVCERTSQISNSIFEQNFGEVSGVLSAISSALELSNSLFRENRSARNMAGVVLQLSTLRMEWCTFENQTSASGAFLYLYHSSGLIEATSFREGSASALGGALLASDSSLLLRHCTFERLSARIGGAASIQSNSNLTFFECVFRNVTSGNGVIYVFKSVLSIADSRFENFSESAVLGTEASLRVSNSSFADNGVAAAGGGVACSSCFDISVSHSVFTRLKALTGSAIYLYKAESQDAGQISDCLFELNSADHTGAAHLENVSIALTNNSFLDNRSEKGAGLALINGVFSVRNNTFLRNSARTEGGGVFWQGSEPHFLNNTFHENSAEYGNEIASYAVRLALQGDHDLCGLPSGQKNNRRVSVVLLDHYDAVVTSDSVSDAQLMSRDWNTSLGGVTRVMASRGRFEFSEFVVVAPPGTNTSIIVLTSAIPQNNTVDINATMRTCERGESRSGSQCIVCEAGTYSLDPQTICSSCPTQAFCLGNFTMVPRKGYWRAQPFTDKFFTCPNTDSCLGSPNTLNLIGECAEGYEGNKCQSCAVGYLRWGRTYCIPCPATSVQIVTRLVIMLVVGLLIGAMVRATLLSQSEHSVYVKVYINYLQLVMLLDSFQLAWPQLMMQLFEIQESLGAFPEIVFSLDCLKDGATNQETYLRRLFLLAFMQPALVGLSSVMWGLIAWVKHSASLVKNEMVASGIVVFFFAYPSVIRAMMDVFNCEEIKPSEYWIVGHDIRCWTLSHEKYAFGLALPSMLLWGLGVPAGLALCIRLQRAQLATANGKKRYGFLVHCYRTEKYYWEFVCLLRKTCIVGITALLSRVSIAFQVLSSLGILALSIVLQRKYEPYAEQAFNALETQALVITTATLYAGLCFYAEALSEGPQVLLFIAVVLANAYFTVMCLNRPFRGLVRLLRGKFREISKLWKVHPASQPSIEALNPIYT